MKNLFLTLPVAKEIWNASYCLSHSMLNHRTCYLLWWIFKISIVKPLSPLVIIKAFHDEIFIPFFPYGKSLRIFNIRIKSYQSFHIFTLFPSLVIKFLSRFMNWIQVFRKRVECIFKCKYQTSAICRVQVSNQYHNSLTVTV